MNSIAVFIDAGYLFAQGSTALSGAPVPRSQLKLDEVEISKRLKELALKKGDGCRLLRIYWYDGSASGRMSMDQSALANSDDIKLRLGQINSAGQQKGVDSLIVTDLIELARNQAVTDAVLMSGDEDVRVGVQIAQSFGVRVHLLGIDGRKSQSPLLMQESDTTSLWNKDIVSKFLSVKVATAAATPPPASSKATTTQKMSLDDVANKWASELDDDQIRSFSEFRKTSNSVPTELDGKLLAKARDALGRDLDQNEKRNIRAKFVDAVKKRKPDLFNT